MFLKLNLDTGHCFSVLGSSTKIVPKTGVSGPPLENIEPINKDRKHKVLHTPNGKKWLSNREQRWVVKKIDCNETSNFGAKIVHAKSSTKCLNHVEIERTSFVDYPCSEIAKQNVYNDVSKKLNDKCSKKWLNYGGCIPAILQALDETKDLDEALKPWEESLNNKERSIILKEQSNWERALEIFEWFKSKDCHELNVIHYNIVLRILGRAKKWRKVEMICNEMCFEGIEPINSTYGTLIDAYSKAGHKKEALCWLARMNKRGIEPDEVTMGIVVQLYKKSGEFRKAEDFFKKWSLNEEKVVRSVSLSSHTYNTLIDTYGKAGRLKEASEVFSQMLDEGIEPTIVTFNTMIHICGNNGYLDEVASLIAKMDELCCPAETRTYNILISLHTKHNDIDTASKYFIKMKEALLEPDIVSYRTLLYAYSIRNMVSEAEDLVSEMDLRGLEIDEFTQSALTRMYIESGELKKSWLWFRRFHLKGNMSSECYSANIDAYGERGFVSEAEAVFRCSQEAERPSAVLEFNVMIKAYGVGKLYHEACALFDSMDSHGVVPDKCSYNSLIQILAGADVANNARQYLIKMQASGFVTDCVPYCVVISSFIKLGNLEMAETLYTEMVKRGVEPDVVVFGIMINAFADVDLVEKALVYVEEMKRLGLRGNEVVHNSLIKLYTKAGMLREAQETYRTLIPTEDGPSIFSSNCMIDLYSERSMVGPAEEVFERLRRSGAANEFAYAMMMRLYRKIGQFEEGVVIIRQMRELGILTDLLSYNNAIGLYAVCGRFREAVATFEEMLEKRVPPDDSTFKSLTVVLSKLGVSKRAVGELEVSTKRDPQGGVPKWVEILSSVVGEFEV